MKKLFLSLLLVLSFSALSVDAQTQWTNPLEQGENIIHGRWWQSELQSTYHRLPDRAEKVVRPPVWTLSKDAAGLSIVFRTSATNIKVRYQVTKGLSMFHMPSTGVSGLDMYATDAEGRRHWVANRFNASFGDTIKHEFKNLSYLTNIRLGYEYHLYLPLYNEVSWLEIGIPEGESISFVPESLEKPIVVYGTSIAQGACASRPGMAWTNIVERETEHPLINLAFSGNGRLEEDVFQYLAEIDAKLYIIDCLPNMDGMPELIYDRTVKGIEILRSKHNAPILLVEHDYANGETSDWAKNLYVTDNKELRRVYDDMQAKGVKDLYYLSWEELSFTMDAMVEGVHPNDLGMRQYADAYIKKIKDIFGEDSERQSIFKPCTQQRDWYNWKERHELMLQRNRQEAPQIVLIGNSITHFWSDNTSRSEKENKEFLKSWNKLFKGKIVHNQGFGYDRIENGIWRIYHGELDGFDAEKIFLLLGTNNFGTNTDEEIVSGLMQLIHAVRQHQPRAKIYQVGIMPRRNMEARVETINHMIQEKLKGTNVTYVDMSAGFVDENGKLIESLFIGDGLHPNAKGYANEAKNLEPYVKE